MENDKKEKPGSRKIVLSPSTLLTMVFLSITALVLAYIAGVMSGRDGGGEKAPVSVAGEAPSQGRESVQEKILAPEDLKFARALKGQSEKRGSAEASAEKSPAESGTPPETPPAVTENLQEEKAATPADNSISDYLYQMAAFRDENGADNLRQTLEGEGYRTILQKNGKMLVVLVRMRGSAKQARELLELAARLRLGEPVLRERKPLPNL